MALLENLRRIRLEAALDGCPAVAVSVGTDVKVLVEAGVSSSEMPNA